MSSSFCCLFRTYQGRYHQFSAWSYVDQNPNPFIKPSIHLPHHHLPEAEKAFEATPMMARTCVKETLDAWRGGEILEKWRWLLKAKANVFRDVSYCFNPAFLTCFDTLPYLSTRSFREHWTHSLVIFVDLKFENSPIFTFTFAMRFQECSNFSGKKKNDVPTKDMAITRVHVSYVMIQHDPNATRRRLERTLPRLVFFHNMETTGKHHVEFPG